MSESSLSLRRRRAGRGEPDPRAPQDRSSSRSVALARAENGTNGTTPKRRSGDKRRRAGDKRDRILKAAVKVFARSGFHATRVSEVAKAAGVADGTIYLYFKSKEELLVSLFEDRGDKLLAFMREELPKQPDAPARLRAVIDMQLGLLEGERDLAEVITVILRQSTRLMKEFATPHFSAYLDAIAKIIAEGQATGAFRQDVSPHIAARAIFGALDGITLTWALGRAEQGALGRAAGQLADVLLRGLAP
jgi:TetR/AcrR family transcriptional regulator, fatty acid metabolism regulator protein